MKKKYFFETIPTRAKQFNKVINLLNSGTLANFGIGGKILSDGRDVLVYKTRNLNELNVIRYVLISVIKMTRVNYFAGLFEFLPYRLKIRDKHTIPVFVFTEPTVYKKYLEDNLEEFVLNDVVKKFPVVSEPIGSLSPSMRAVWRRLAQNDDFLVYLYKTNEEKLTKEGKENVEIEENDRYLLVKNDSDMID